MSMMNFEANESGKRNITTLINQYGDILSDLFEHISDMLFLMSVEEGTAGAHQYRYVLMNPSAMRYSKLDKSAYGKRFEDVYPAEKAAALKYMYEEAVTSKQPVYYTTEGDIIGESILTPVINADGVCTHVFAVTRDITERKQLEAKLEFMAYHDVLTGLPNRRMLERQLHSALQETKDNDEMVAVLFLDCDHFKQINDTWGHATGDAFLQLLGKRLKACVRSEEDMVCRLGGDEFVVVLRHVQHPAQAEEVADRILTSIQAPWQVDEASFTVTSSIGIALYPNSATQVDELLKRADEALYLAKSTGRNQFYLF